MRPWFSHTRGVGGDRPKWSARMPMLRMRRRRVSLVGGAAEPFRGLRLIRFDAPAGDVEKRQVVLRRDVALLSGAAVPLGRLGVVLHHAIASVVHQAKRVTLRLSI